MVMMLVGVNAFADSTPTVLFHETFGDNSGSARAWSDTYSVKSGVSAVYSGITSYTVSNAKQGKNTTGSTKSGLNQSTQGTDAYIIVGPLSVANYESLAVTYQWKAASVSKTYSTKLYYATSSTGSYTEVSGTGNGATSFVTRSYSLPEAAQVSTLYLKVVWNTSNTQAIIDELELTGTAAAAPTSIAVTTAPTKTTYASGEKLDLSGLVVTATYDGGDTKNVTSSCTFSPANGTALTTSNDKVTISYSGKSCEQAITVKKTTPTITANDVTISIGDIKQLTATSNPTATITYSIVSGDSYVDLADDVIEGKAVGTAVLRASVAASSEVEAAYKDFNVNVLATANEATLDLSKATYASASADAVTWLWDYVTMSNAKGTGTAANNYIPSSQTSTRFYNGNTLTITPVSGVTISKIEFTATTAGYATALGTTSEWTNATTSVSNSAAPYTVTVTPADGTQTITAAVKATCGFTSMKLYYYGAPTLANIIVSAAKYATYYNSQEAYTMPANMEGYIWTDRLEQKYYAGDVVPAGEALVLKADAGNYTLNFTTDHTVGAGNKLLGTDEATTLTEDNDYYFYGLSLNAEGETSSVGFYWMNATGAAFTNGAHKAYLKLAKTSGAPSYFVFSDNNDENGSENAISNINAEENAAECYDLMGRKSNGKGLMISNGKVMIVK